MQIYLYKDNQQAGPFPIETLRERAAEGFLSRSDMAWYEGCPDWIELGRVPGMFPSPPPLRAMPQPRLQEASDETIIRRICDYEGISGILWIALGIFQICTILGIIAGVWNIIAGISRRNAVELIAQRDPKIPLMYQGVAQLIVIGLINLFLGGVIGLIFVAFDFYIRDKVLTNASLFVMPPGSERHQIA